MTLKTWILFFSIITMAAYVSGICVTSINGETYLNGILLDRGSHQISSRTMPNGRVVHQVITRKNNGETTVKTYEDDGRTSCGGNLANSAASAANMNMNMNMNANNVMQSICQSFPDWMKATVNFCKNK